MQIFTYHENLFKQAHIFVSLPGQFYKLEASNLLFPISWSDKFENESRPTSSTNIKKKWWRVCGLRVS